MAELEAVGALEQVFWSLEGTSLNVAFARQQIKILLSERVWQDLTIKIIVKKSEIDWDLIKDASCKEIRRSRMRMLRDIHSVLLSPNKTGAEFLKSMIIVISNSSNLSGFKCANGLSKVEP